MLNVHQGMEMNSGKLKVSKMKKEVCIPWNSSFKALSFYDCSNPKKKNCWKNKLI